MSQHPMQLSRWTITAGLVVMTAAAIAWAPRLVPPASPQVEVATESDVADAALKDWCVRVGKLECCLAEDE